MYVWGTNFQLMSSLSFTFIQSLLHFSDNIFIFFLTFIVIFFPKTMLIQPLLKSFKHSLTQAHVLIFTSRSHKVNFNKRLALFINFHDKHTHTHTSDEASDEIFVYYGGLFLKKSVYNTIIQALIT